jgi:hypothetical protein
MNNATYTPTSTLTKTAFAALALAVVASFAGGLKASEQNAVAQAASVKLEVRVVAPVVVIAKRDIRQLEMVEIVGHRADTQIAQTTQGGKRKPVMTARAAI